MNASEFEQDLAAANGVTIRHWLQPKRVIAEGGKVSAIELEYTAMNGDRLAGTGETLTLAADQVFKAIGQSFVPAALNGSGAAIALEGGRIKVDAEGRTSLAKVWAGGDCIFGGDDLTVSAVAQGRDAAESDPSRHSTCKREDMSMADIRNNFVGIKSPNPFWLASAPPTDKAYNVIRAFKAGWGGVVWKTLGEEGPPVVNVNGPRYGAIWGADRRLLGLNNIELITDRDLQVNLREIKQVKKDWPDRAMVVSLMVPCVEESLEGDPAGGRGDRRPTASSSISAARTACRSAAWARPSARCRNTSKWWCAGASSNTRMPVITKLTPNITDMRKPARAANAAAPTRCR